IFVQFVVAIVGGVVALIVVIVAAIVFELLVRLSKVRQNFIQHRQRRRGWSYGGAGSGAGGGGGGCMAVEAEGFGVVYSLGEQRRRRMTKTKPDETISVKLSFLESTWKKADRFKCISVSLLPEFEYVEINENMSDNEKSECKRMHDSEYMKYIKKSKACTLSSDAENEIMKMMSEQDKVNSKLLQRIRERVEKWYHDQGYVLAEVVNFGNLGTKEVVCDVAKGDITRIVGQFHDKFGNVCEGKTQLGLIQRQLPEQIAPSLLGLVQNLYQNSLAGLAHQVT
ncbi:protein TOC75-3, chloroplastic, partial [Tanacetum coccineum]